MPRPQHEERGLTDFSNWAFLQSVCGRSAHENERPSHSLAWAFSCSLACAHPRVRARLLSVQDGASLVRSEEHLRPRCRGGESAKRGMASRRSDWDTAQCFRDVSPVRSGRHHGPGGSRHGVSSVPEQARRLRPAKRFPADLRVVERGQLGRHGRAPTCAAARSGPASG